MQRRSISLPDRLRIAVLLPLGHQRGGDLLRGILRFADSNPRWELRTRSVSLEACKVAAAWRPHGIIANAHLPAMIRSLRQCDVPVVNISGRLADQPFAQVLVDNKAVGAMAADYFMARGYRHYASLMDIGSLVGDQREQGFSERLAEFGFKSTPHRIGDDEGVFEKWELADSSLGEWVKSLPKPVAILSGDSLGPVLTHACADIGVAVPEHAAVLGVDNDELLCRQSHPALSSIAIPHEEAGYRVATLLDSMMTKAVKTAESIFLPPIGVVTRASTDTLAIDDPQVAEAVRYINRNAHRRINVHHVVQSLGTGRRTLEARFRRIMGRTLLDEIHRVCIERAKIILAQTSRPLATVSLDSGFRDSQHMWVVFQKTIGVSPAVYRRTKKSY